MALHDGYDLCLECQEKEQADKDYRERIRQLTREELEAALLREAELRGEWERKALGIKLRDPEDPDPCQASLESAELVIIQAIKTETGELVSRSKRTYQLDPQQFSMSQYQQYEDIRNRVLVWVKKKIGKPILVAQGVVVGGQNDPWWEEAPDDLEVLIEKTANVVTIELLWLNESVSTFRATDQEVLCAVTEEFSRKLDSFCEASANNIGRGKVTPRAIRCAISEAVKKLEKKLRK